MSTQTPETETPSAVVKRPIPLVDLKAQYASIQTDVDAAVARVMRHGGFILGEEVKRFESAFAQFVGCAGAVGVSSGTSALRLALQACGVGPGDEVITVAHTFIATAEAVSHLGASPVFVDIDPVTYTMDPLAVERALTIHTKAILPVHLYGHPANMDALLAIGRDRKIPVIEDAAQAHGAFYHGTSCGAIGALACFSFYPGKNLGACGDAGMVTGNDEELLSRVRQLRDHGRVDKYEHKIVGWGERIDALQAAILGAKLPYLASWVDSRRAHAAVYSELLRDTPLGLPATASECQHAFHLYVVRAKRRDAVLAQLKNKGIFGGIHYPIPLHRQPAYAEHAHRSLPVTETAAAEVMSLPLYPEMTGEQITEVATAVKDALNG